MTTAGAYYTYSQSSSQQDYHYPTPQPPADYYFTPARRSPPSSRPSSFSSNPYHHASNPTLVAPPPRTQNPPYHPLTHQTTPPSQFFDPQQPSVQALVPYPSHSDIYTIGATPPHTPPQTQTRLVHYERSLSSPDRDYYLTAQDPEREVYYPPSQLPEPRISMPRPRSYSYARPEDDYDTAPRASVRDRRYSSSSARSYHSRRSDDSSGGRSMRSFQSGSRRQWRSKKERDEYVAALDRKPSFGDSVLVTFKILKGVVTGRRE